MRYLICLYQLGGKLLFMAMILGGGKNAYSDDVTFPFRYVFLGSSSTCDLAVGQAALLVNGGRTEVTENERASAQIFSGAAAPAFCDVALPGSAPTPPLIVDQGWNPSGAGLLPDPEKGQDPRCTLMEDGNYSTGQILAAACRMPEIEGEE